MSNDKQFEWQTLLPDCDCKSGGIIMYENTPVCRWCRKPYGNGGVMYYLPEHFEQSMPKQERIEVSHLWQHDNFKGNDNDSFWYQFCTSKPIEHINNSGLKEAIEQALNPTTDTKTYTQQEVDSMLLKVKEETLKNCLEVQGLLEKHKKDTVSKEDEKEELVGLLRDCVSSTWGNPSLDKTQVLFDKFLHDRKLAPPSKELVNSFLTDAVNRNVYDKKYSQKEVDAMIATAKEQQHQLDIQTLPENKASTNTGNEKNVGEKVVKWAEEYWFIDKLLTGEVLLDDPNYDKMDYPKFRKVLVGNINETIKGLFNPNENSQPTQAPKEEELKDWEILSFVVKNVDGFNGQVLPKIDGYFGVKDFNVTESDLLKSSIHEIHSVKRKDGVVFSCQEETEQGVIGTMYINHDVMYVAMNHLEGVFNLNDISKLPTPTEQTKSDVLFTTEDGVGMCATDCYFSVNKEFKHSGRSNGLAWYNPSSGEKYFSTKEAAEQYIIENKPCLSVKDTMDFLRLHFEVTGKMNPTHGEIRDALIEIYHQKSKN